MEVKAGVLEDTEDMVEASGQPFFCSTRHDAVAERVRWMDLTFASIPLLWTPSWRTTLKRVIFVEARRYQKAVEGGVYMQ